MDFGAPMWARIPHREPSVVHNDQWECDADAPLRESSLCTGGARCGIREPRWMWLGVSR